MSIATSSGLSPGNSNVTTTVLESMDSYRSNLEKEHICEYSSERRVAKRARLGLKEASGCVLACCPTSTEEVDGQKRALNASSNRRSNSEKGSRLKKDVNEDMDIARDN